MLHRIIAVGTLVLVAACGDRTLGPSARPPASPSANRPAGPSAGPPVALAKMFAKALKNPAFRAYLKAQLDVSPYVEHKLAFETFLGASGGRALRQIATENGLRKEAVSDAASQTVALEVYFPVPGHRATWSGDENVLVATALTDQDAPIAFTPSGQRHVLDRDTPPATPVLALVPIETDFARPARQECFVCDEDGGDAGDPPAPSPAAAGLYMTKAHFTQDFESWLKGNPEFEVQILGQKGQTDSLVSYQCAGEHAGGPYTFDQNGLDWTGSVLLFSQTQLDNYNASHPGQNVRVFVVEDDDTACQIRTDPDRFQKLVLRVDSIYNRLTTGNDSSTVVQRAFKYGKAAYNVFQALAHWIKSNDELVGNAVEDEIVGSFYPGYNWFVKGENNITNGWINLVMR